MDRRHVAAQLYTLRDFLRTPEDVARTLPKVRAMGYEAVQVSGLGPIEPERLKEIADASGLAICVTHSPVQRFRTDLPGLVREHRLWGCRYVGLGAMPDEFRDTRDGFLRFAEEFSAIGRALRAEGLKFVYHNHHFEFGKFGGETGMDILFRETDPEAFGFLLDTYWVQAGGANPVDWIRKVRGRMDVVHLKDMAIHGWKQVYAEIGEGNLDWDAIVAACRETGVSWYAVEQDECDGSPFDSLAKSFGYLGRYF